MGPFQGTAIGVGRASDVRFVNCTVHAVGGQAFRFVEGPQNSPSQPILVDHSGIDSSRIFDTGCGGCWLSGGNVTALNWSHNFLINTTIAHTNRVVRTYAPPVDWNGLVGGSFINNTVTDAPHAGFLGSGNDCLFEGNRIANVTFASDDTGAFCA